MALNKAMRATVAVDGAVEVDKCRVTVGECIVEDALQTSLLGRRHGTIGGENGLPLIQSDLDG